jgi:hypothetical protein
MGPLMKLLRHKPSNPDMFEVLFYWIQIVQSKEAIATEVLPLESSVEFNSYLSDVEVMISLKDVVHHALVVVVNAYDSPGDSRRYT